MHALTPHVDVFLTSNCVFQAWRLSMNVTLNVLRWPVRDTGVSLQSEEKKGIRRSELTGRTKLGSTPAERKVASS